MDGWREGGIEMDACMDGLVGWLAGWMCDSMDA